MLHHWNFSSFQVKSLLFPQPRKLDDSFAVTTPYMKAASHLRPKRLGSLTFKVRSKRKQIIYDIRRVCPACQAVLTVDQLGFHAELFLFNGVADHGVNVSGMDIS